MTNFDSSAPVTLLLNQCAHGDAKICDQAYDLVYDELVEIADRLMRRERVGHTIDATALVHEAYIKLTGLKQTDWRDRKHFFGVARAIMQRFLIDYGRRHNAGRRPDGKPREPLTLSLPDASDRVDALVLNEALDELELLDPRQYQIVTLRYYGGHSVQEVADLLGVSKRAVEGEWTMARSWLERRLATRA